MATVLKIERDGLATTVADLCSRIEHLLSEQASSPRERILIALAGVPGSGKSTICAAVLNALLEHGQDHVAVVPMDGFHYSQAQLSKFKDPLSALNRGGAPFTFDAAANFRLLLEVIIYAPSFDHAHQDPVSDDIQISSRTKVVIIEGNYTLLDEAPWKSISDLVHDSWFVDAPPEIAKERLIKRHMAAGIEASRLSALQRVEDNDCPNGNYIRSKLVQPNIIIRN